MLSEGWFLYAGDRATHPNSGLIREVFELSPPGEGQVIAEPLYGAWEGNMGHALNRSPVDVCKWRREDRGLLGNSGVVRVLECGPAVSSVKVGDFAIVFCGTDRDPFGYPKKILGYD